MFITLKNIGQSACLTEQITHGFFHYCTDMDLLALQTNAKEFLLIKLYTTESYTIISAGITEKY